MGYAEVRTGDIDERDVDEGTRKALSTLTHLRLMVYGSRFTIGEEGGEDNGVRFEGWKYGTQ